MIKNDTWYRCTICGREGFVGRCCGDETREPLNELAIKEQAKMEIKMNQKQLFAEWNLACDRLRLLSSFVQNDFDSMLQNRYVTKEDIKKSIQEFNELYSKTITQIFELKTEIEKVLNKYAD